LCYFSVSNSEAKRKRRRKFLKKKNKKNNLVREEDQSASWRYSDVNSSAAALSVSLRANDNSAPDMRLKRTQRQKHRKKMKKEREKMPHVGWQEEVSYVLYSSVIIYCCSMYMAGHDSDGS
jgi:hypothetical protein